MEIPVEGHKNLVRDKFSKAIVNIDSESREIKKKRREVLLKEKEELNQIKSDISDLKNMMSKILDKLG
tara:strand:- start:534 stop:737 length:204 start_codon:yes stop_codon:yes gene_type:complete